MVILRKDKVETKRGRIMDYVRNSRVNIIAITEGTNTYYFIVSYGSSIVLP